MSEMQSVWPYRYESARNRSQFMQRQYVFESYKRHTNKFQSEHYEELHRFKSCDDRTGAKPTSLNAPYNGQCSRSLSPFCPGNQS